MEVRGNAGRSTEQIRELTEGLRTAEAELAEKTEKLEKYPKLMEELETKHRAEQQVQASFNQANERSIQRLTQRELERERILDRMFFRMVEFVENEQAKLTANKPGAAGAGGRRSSTGRRASRSWKSWRT